jgi:hypothetical protein
MALPAVPRPLVEAARCPRPGWAGSRDISLDDLGTRLTAPAHRARHGKPGVCFLFGNREEGGGGPGFSRVALRGSLGSCGGRPLAAPNGRIRGLHCLRVWEGSNSPGTRKKSKAFLVPQDRDLSSWPWPGSLDPRQIQA